MLARARNLSSVQKIGAGIGVILLLCCSCSGCLGFASLLVSSQSIQTAAIADEVIEAESDSIAPESAAESAQESTSTPLPPTDTPQPPATPRPTNTPRPTQTPVSEPAMGQLTLDSGEEISGELATVTRIIDGDTIEVDINGQTYRVRYIGMDTPERGDPFFDEATEANSQLVAGQIVILVKDVSETDRFGRLLRYVYLQDGTFVNAELVKQGYALLATFPPDVAHESDFTALQEEARNAGLGLWAEVVVVAPTKTPAPTNTPAPLPTHTPLPAQPTNTPAPQPTHTPEAPPATNTPLPPPTQPPAAPGNVVITFIFFDGNVPSVESDEYAEITNQGGTAVNLAGWRLNADDPGQDFWFPSFDLQPGQSCRVYTNEIHPETCGFSFGIGRAIWANSGDCGHLYDASGVEVSTRCY